MYFRLVLVAVLTVLVTVSPSLVIVVITTILVITLLSIYPSWDMPAWMGYCQLAPKQRLYWQLQTPQLAVGWVDNSP